MKLDKSALLEIVAIIQDALVNGNDASDGLRQLDLTINEGPEGTNVLGLSMDYIATHPRPGTWSEG